MSQVEETVRRAIWAFVSGCDDDAVRLPAIQFLANRDDLLAAAIVAALPTPEPITGKSGSSTPVAPPSDQGEVNRWRRTATDRAYRRYYIWRTQEGRAYPLRPSRALPSRVGFGSDGVGVAGGTGSVSGTPIIGRDFWGTGMSLGSKSLSDAVQAWVSAQTHPITSRIVAWSATRSR